MLVEPRAPDELQRIARLQKAMEAAGASAAHQAEMAAMGARQKLDNDRAFAVLLDAENDAFVAPFHVRPPYPRRASGSFFRRIGWPCGVARVARSHASRRAASSAGAARFFAAVNRSSAASQC